MMQYTTSNSLLCLGFFLVFTMESLLDLKGNGSSIFWYSKKHSTDCRPKCLEEEQSDGRIDKLRRRKRWILHKICIYVRTRPDLRHSRHKFPHQIFFDVVEVCERCHCHSLKSYTLLDGSFFFVFFYSFFIIGDIVESKLFDAKY